MSNQVNNRQMDAPILNVDTVIENSISGHEAQNGSTGSSSRRRLNSREPLLSNAPIDRYKLVIISFSILGITTLLPWNFFITATEYWMYKFRNVTDPNYNPDDPHNIKRTPLQTFFTSYLTIAANLPMLASLILNSLYGHRFSQKSRLYVSLSTMLIIFATTTLLVGVNTDNFQNVFFALTLIMVFVINIFSAIFQAAMFGIAASFPEKFMYSMVSGQAVAGLLAVAIQVLSMLSDSGPITSGLYYFLTSTIFLALAIFCYWIMDNDYSRYYLIHLPRDLELSTSLSENIVQNRSDILLVVKDIWPMILASIIGFWSTLAVYPGIAVLVSPLNPKNSPLSGRFYTPIFCFLLYNIGDLVGRVGSSWLPMKNKRVLLGFSVARIIIPVLVIFCNVNPRYRTPVLFQSDWYFPILNFATATTQGYIFSVAMVLASTSCSRDKVELAGFIMTAALGFGLTLGSISSTIILLII